METSDKIIREAAENREDSPAYYKKAILECMAEIQETVERIHRAIEERTQTKDNSDKLIAQLLNQTQERIEDHQKEIARLESENAILRARLGVA